MPDTVGVAIAALNGPPIIAIRKLIAELARYRKSNGHALQHQDKAKRHRDEQISDGRWADVGDHIGRGDRIDLLAI